MPNAKYIRHDNGRLKETEAVSVSQGASSAGAIPALGTDGRFDLSLMPTGIAPDVLVAVASDNLSAGMFVNVWDDNGTISIRRADASTAGKESDGFVLESATAGEQVMMYFEGRNTSLADLVPGKRYYLSTTNPGMPSDTVPVGTGNVVQYLGRAVSPTTIAYEGTDGIILA